ncbi:DUF1440 domain-containing protein [Sphingomonas sp. AOB5]|uniref:DUF1440 domain-containing protein n=1 Tax=Sphingomonas sp. AOB5 TaxID=3034017 RepID=UPI0023F846DE|nr:DUF1440 domain-containing protein [Sphingomonas sp. AOB5]MDF7777005.1 DUF1440 domain-containing protein [Sphingomonas sp. AOB5]
MSTGPRPFIGLAAGIAAGLVAAAAMSAFQAQLARLPAEDDDAPAEPPASEDASPYVIGAVMGGIYGVLTEYRPEASAGFGGAYGLAAAALADPAAVLDADPEIETSEPVVWGVASHLVFGAVLEGVRWLLAGRRRT